MSNPTISVIIINWNTCDLLAECLHSLEETISDISYDIWVVDNASSDDSLIMLKNRFPFVKVIKNSENIGFGRANNQAMAICNGDFMLLINSDAVVMPGAIQAMLKLAQSQQRAAIIGAQLQNTDGSFQASYSPFPTLWQELLILSGLGRKLCGYHYPSRGAEDSIGPQDVDHVEGACMLVRRSAYLQIGGFDENYFMYAEEVDWCYTMKETGWEIWYQPKARIIHHGSGSSEERRTQREGDLYQSRVRFFRKHYGGLSATILKAMIYGFTAVKIAFHGLIRFISKGKRGRIVISIKELTSKLENV